LFFLIYLTLFSQCASIYLVILCCQFIYMHEGLVASMFVLMCCVSIPLSPRSLLILESLLGALSVQKCLPISFTDVKRQRSNN
jgi:hypothetical protein